MKYKKAWGVTIGKPTRWGGRIYEELSHPMLASCGDNLLSVIYETRKEDIPGDEILPMDSRRDIGKPQSRQWFVRGGVRGIDSRDTVGAICASGYKGIRNEDIDLGKVILVPI